MHALKDTLRRILDGQIAAAIAEDSTVADRHFRFLCAQLALGVVGLAAFPVWLALGAPGSPLVSLALVMLLAPLGIAAFVVRTGRIETGQHATSAVLAGLTATLVLVTGGLSSPAVVLLAVLPLAARLGGDQSVILTAAGAAVMGFVAIAVIDLSGLAGSPSALIQALTAGAIALVAIAASTFTALRLAGRGGRVAQAGRLFGEQAHATTRPVGSEGGAAGEFTAEAGGVIESMAALSTLLANEHVPVDPAERRQLTALLRASGRNAGLAADNAELAEPSHHGVPRRAAAATDMASVAAAAIAATASLATERRVKVYLSGGDLPLAAIDPAECTTIVAALLAAVLRSCRRDDSLAIIVEHQGNWLRLGFRSGCASMAKPMTGQPFFHPHSPYTGLAHVAKLGFAEIGTRVRLSGGDLRLGPRGPGGLIVGLSLPVAEASRGDDRHVEESRNREVRKSA